MARINSQYVPINPQYAANDILRLFEYLTLEIPCEIRFTSLDHLWGKFVSRKASLEFMCSSPESGPITGFSFLPVEKSYRKRLSKSETELLRRIKQATRDYISNHIIYD